MNITFDVVNETLTLLPEKAVYWERKKTLFITDTHFGKTDSFRAHGIPVPTGSLDNDINVLTSLIEKLKPEIIFFLGDLFHAKKSKNEELMRRLTTWREKFSNVEMNLIRGNHDQHAGDPCEELKINCFDGPFEIAPFILSHDPQVFPSGYTLCGHVHPAVKLTGNNIPSASVPCFYFSKHYAILPAFGSFTGTYKIKPVKGDNIFLATGTKVIPA
ncbi:ligase-associated DNA damage response endonuclease PdeM [soil metagenome]